MKKLRTRREWYVTLDEIRLKRDVTARARVKSLKWVKGIVEKLKREESEEE